MRMDVRVFRKIYSKILSAAIKVTALIVPSYDNKVLKNFEKNHLRELYKITGQDYHRYLQNYQPLCDYLNFSICNEYKYTLQNGFLIDGNGIPKVLRNGEYVYNIVVICQYAFVLYGQYLRGLKSKDEFLKLADDICEFQAENGGYYYYYNFPYYLQPDFFTDEGWTGAMQHGHVLSVMARAYSLSKNEKYVICADKVVEFLRRDISDGGVKGHLETLQINIEGLFFEEYPVEPESFTLNGYIFTLLGLYDWGKSTEYASSNEAMKNFKLGVESLERVLPLYDFDGASCYDLGHITYNKKKLHYFPDYHAIHIAQCYILYGITGKTIFKDYAEKWKGLIE